MPQIAEINNIKICIYPNDHNPPHVHCYKSGRSAVIDIRTGVVIMGNMKAADLKKVKSWIAENRDVLLEMWSRKIR